MNLGLIHIDALSLHEVLVGSTIVVIRDGTEATHVVAPGLASYLVEKYRNHPTISVQSLNENGATS